MSSRSRLLLCSAALVLAFGLGHIDVAGRETPPFAQFGGAVLVGDGEVFAGESQNQFRPGMVYVFRKTGASWVEATTIASPKSAVSDGFGSSLALDGSTLFVGAGASAVHVYTKQGANWTYASTVDAAMVPMPPAPPAPAPAAPPAGGAPAAAAAPAGPPVAQFGGAVAASGDWLLVGKAIAGGRGRGGAGPITAGSGPRRRRTGAACRRRVRVQARRKRTVRVSLDDRIGRGCGDDRRRSLRFIDRHDGRRGDYRRVRSGFRRRHRARVQR